MQVNEGSTLTFDIYPGVIFSDMEYDLVVRHAQNPNFPNIWENANVELIRTENATGPCNETQDEVMPFQMASDLPYTEIEPSLCLEAGKAYQVKFTFDQYDPGAANEKANILIDSVIIFRHIIFDCT